MSYIYKFLMNIKWSENNLSGLRGRTSHERRAMTCMGVTPMRSPRVRQAHAGFLSSRILEGLPEISKPGTAADE